MPARYFLNSSNVLLSYTEIDSIDPPAGETAVAKSVIDAAYVGDVLIGGTWDGTIYTPPAGQVTLARRQRRFIWDAYIWWRTFGRTQHWAGLRRGIATSEEQLYAPLEATDKWARHILGIADQAIRGNFPITGAYTPAELVAFLNHMDNIYRTLGPTWYKAQIRPANDPENKPHQSTTEADMYRGHTANSLYTDTVTATGVLRTIDGTFGAMAVNFHADFDEEDPMLGA